MDKKITIAVKEPGKNFKEVKTTGKLHDLQRIVGGYLEALTMGNGFVLWCNEEGKILGLEPNFWYCGELIVGNVFITREDGDGGIASLTKKDIEDLKETFNEYDVYEGMENEL